jgi:putative transcriptional regulator
MRKNVRLLFVAAMLLATAAEAQAPGAGMLLVAAPELDDPNFAESVVLLVYHDDNGSLGIFVNRPTNLRPSRVFPDIAPLARYEDDLFLGGPLEPRQLLLLVRSPAPGVLEGPPVLQDIYISADADVLARLPAAGADASRVRLYAGHAAWGSGQLEEEIAAGDWYVLPGHADRVFTAEPLELWRSAGRLGGGLVADRNAR